MDKGRPCSKWLCPWWSPGGQERGTRGLLFVRVVRSVISAGFARLRNGATSTVRRGSSDREVLVGQDDDSAPVQMFCGDCGDCGDKSVEGDHTCRVCGPGQLPASALNPDAAVAREEPKLPPRSPLWRGLFKAHRL